jgi:DNA-binding CsgD family transcriptional regulator
MRLRSNGSSRESAVSEIVGSGEAESVWEAGANLAPAFAGLLWTFVGGLFDAPDLARLRAAALALPAVIPGSPTLFKEVDLTTGEVTTVSDCPAATSPAATAAYARLRHEHPVVAVYERGGALRPLAISDVTDEGAFTGTAFYRTASSTLAMRDQLVIPVPIHHRKVHVAVFIGRSTWGFSEEEHIAANVIQRSLHVAYGSLLERRSARTASGVSSDLLERSGVQVAVVDRFGEIGGLDGERVSLDPRIAEAITSVARLASAAPRRAREDEQRAVIAEIKVRASSGETVTVQLLASDDGEAWPVTLRRAAPAPCVDSLIARGLTRRQAEVMALLLAGRTTTGAALEMGISPRTAEKHIVLACQALGARSRTDALIALASGDPATVA